MMSEANNLSQYVGTEVLPNYESIVEEEISLPYDDGRKFLRLSYSDPKLKDYSLIVVADSSNGDSVEGRLTSVILRYPRYVHSEALRHRVKSRNAASSRARSVKTTIKDVMENPVIPLFTVNQRGMSGKFPTLDVREKLIESWLRARDRAVASALELLVGPQLFDHYGSGFEDTHAVAHHWEQILDDYYENGYDGEGNPKEGYLSAHKQQVNRIIEPYTLFEEVVTSSYWQNYLSLRNHEDAQGEIRATAVLVERALELSTPTERDFHLPFIAEKDYPTVLSSWHDEIKPVMLRSAAEAAQISYGDKSRSEQATATAALGERLFNSRHYSPFEHQAIADKAYVNVVFLNPEPELEGDFSKLTSNLSPLWVQSRIVLAGITK